MTIMDKTFDEMCGVLHHHVFWAFIRHMQDDENVEVTAKVFLRMWTLSRHFWYRVLRDEERMEVSSLCTKIENRDRPGFEESKDIWSFVRNKDFLVQPVHALYQLEEVSYNFRELSVLALLFRDTILEPYTALTLILRKFRDCVEEMRADPLTNHYTKLVILIVAAKAMNEWAEKNDNRFANHYHAFHHATCGDSLICSAERFDRMLEAVDALEQVVHVF